MSDKHGKLGDSCCELWWARLSSLQDLHVNLLDNVEQTRREMFVHSVDRDRFTLAAVLLRVVASRHLQLHPAKLRVDRTCPLCTRPHGRPRLLGQDLKVSVSHSGDVVVVALTTVADVGIDVERITNIAYEPMVPDVFVEEEAIHVTSHFEFFRRWTRKESLMKATGDGLRIPMTEVVLTDRGGETCLVRYGNKGALACRIVDLSPGPGYVAAAAVLTATPIRFREQDAAESLTGPWE